MCTGLTTNQIASPILGFADDYAFTVRALLDLYEVTFEAAWVEWAAQLQDRQDELFWDQSGGKVQWRSSRNGRASLLRFSCY